ncbi:unnamed protein product [Onchocerca ochengi]|uniref:Kinesin motor domain-containing protein n=1 Tax=Onchocerca ochengi TaxID=42157 RepID=A0A182EPD1_ONCOC|nr:unnamed protein product [Onchocerca ochengi]
MSEIKSKHQNDEFNDDFRKSLFPANNSQVFTVNDSRVQNSEYNRSSYEQGRTHSLGRRTPEMPSRRMFTLVSSQNQYSSDTESINQPPWRKNSSRERSLNAVDVDGFTSMRRRKIDDNTFRMDSKSIPVSPTPYSKNFSLFSERSRHDRSSSSYSSLNSPSHLSLNFSTTEKYSTQKNLSDVKAAMKTYTGNISNGVLESDFMQLTNDDTLAVGSKVSNNDVNVNGLCFQCYNLQKQLSDLSYRLKQATEEIKNRTAKEELTKKAGDIVGVEKSVANSFEMLNDAVNVKNKDAASDASIIKVENKGIGVSLEDGIEMHWCNNTACSPIPGPDQHSIGVATDKLLVSSLSRDAATDSPHQELTTIRSVRHFECGTEPVITRDHGCGSDMFAMMCDFSSMTDAVELVDSGTGCKQIISLLKDSSSMTAPITSSLCHIQTEHIKTRNETAIS